MAALAIPAPVLADPLPTLPAVSAYSASSPAGTLSSTGDLQLLVNSGGVYAYQDYGNIPQADLSAAGIPLSDAQNLTANQTQNILNAIAAAALAATSTTAAPVSSCSDVSIAFFGDTSCFSIGSVSIGQTTALVLGAAAVALFFMFRGKK
jgi:hypothetical protein